MTNYREILRLSSQGVSKRGIASSCHCSRNTITAVLERAEQYGISWPLPANQTDAELHELLFPEKCVASSRKMPDCEHIHKEMAKSGVTLSLLWNEYCEECRLSGEIPFMYSQFCRYYGNINVWQIKRYEKFTRKDIQNAIEMFLAGKWKDSAKVFTLCVSNFLNDTGIVDEINEKGKLLSQYGIIFSVLNSEKLTIKAKSYPSLVNDFFGKHWSEAMGLVSKNNSNNITNKKTTWFNQKTGEKIDPDKLYQHGDFKTKIDGDTVYTEYKQPDGNTAYYEFDFKTKSVKNIKYPYPLCEYTLDISPDLILKEESGNTIIQGKVYQAKIIHLKWGKRVVLLFDQGVLIDIDVNTKTFIDNINKSIHVYDLS
jgi:hypothetical protein